MALNKKSPALVTLGVLPIFLVIQAPFVINPLMSALAELYAEAGIPYSMVLMLSTITSLVQVPASLIAGALAGKHIRYKTLSLISVIVALIGGMGPYFIRNFYGVLILRAVLGFGTGLASPLANALVGRLFSSEQAATMQGLGTTIMNVSGVVFQFLAGIVCVINVNYAWLVNLVLVIPLVLMLLFLEEPKQTVQSEQGQAAPKVKLPATVYLISIAWGLIFMVYYPLLLNMSTILVSEGIGNAAVAGTAQSLYTVGGMVAGVAFGKLYKMSGKYVIPISMVLQVAGLAIGYWGTSAAMMMVSTFMTGFAIFTIWPAAVMTFTNILPPEGLSLATGIFSASLGLGGFLTSAYVALVTSITGNDSPRFPILVAVVITAVIDVIWSIASIREKEGSTVA